MMVLYVSVQKGHRSLPFGLRAQSKTGGQVRSEWTGKSTPPCGRGQVEHGSGKEDPRKEDNKQFEI